MARIENAQISFPRGSVGSGLFSVRIQCTIRWSSAELAVRPPFNLEVYFRGEDGASADDNLHVHIFHPEVLDNRIVPSTAVTSSFDRTFSINGRRLNEDDGWLNKQDEIYAVIRLIPEDIASATARTNVATGRFA